MDFSNYCRVAQKERVNVVQFYERFKLLCSEIGKTPTGVGKELGVDGSTVNYWKNNHTPKQPILSKIAEYFGVSVDYLIGKTESRIPSSVINGTEIAKVALFGGDIDVTDEMWQEVLEHVDFVKFKHNKQ